MTSAATWFDSHCHLHLCEEGPGAAVSEARSAGVQEMLTVGIDVATSKLAADLASQEGVYAAVGVHPNDCAGFSRDDAVALEKLAGEPGVVAIGETGLDLYRDAVPMTQQATVFDVHIELAARLDKALVIHTRASVGPALDRLTTSGPPARLVFHCWSGDERELQRALEMGAYVSFAGNVSFKNAPALRNLAALVPEDKVLVETDSPFLSPEPHRGRPNAPKRVVDVGAAVAATRGVAIEEIAAATTGNARRLYGVA